MNGATIRPAELSDLRHIVPHRRAMFEEMGYTDTAILDQMQADSEAYVRDAISRNTYRGWLAEAPDGRVVAGGGIVIADWPGFPSETQRRRGWILNVYTDPDHRRRGLARQITQIIMIRQKNSWVDSGSGSFAK